MDLGLRMEVVVVVSLEGIRALVQESNKLELS